MEPEFATRILISDQVFLKAISLLYLDIFSQTSWPEAVPNGQVLSETKMQVV